MRREPDRLYEGDWEREKAARWKRRKNVVVKGLTLITREMKEEFKKWVWDEMRVKIRVVRIKRIEGG